MHGAEISGRKSGMDRQSSKARFGVSSECPTDTGRYSHDWDAQGSEQSGELPRTE